MWFHRCGGLRLLLATLLRAIRLASARAHKRLATTLAETGARGRFRVPVACDCQPCGQSLASPPLAGGRGLCRTLQTWCTSTSASQQVHAGAGGEPAMLPSTSPAQSARQGASRGLRALPAAQPEVSFSPFLAAPARQGGRPKFPTPHHHATLRMGRDCAQSMVGPRGGAHGEKQRHALEIWAKSSHSSRAVIPPKCAHTPHGQWARTKPSTRFRQLACRFASRQGQLSHA